MSRHPFLAVAVLSLACFALLLPGQVTSSKPKLSPAKSGQNQRPGQVQNQPVQPKVVYVRPPLRKVLLDPYKIPFVLVGWGGLMAASQAWKKWQNGELEAPPKASQTGEPRQPIAPPVAPLAPIPSAVATGSSRPIILTLMISIAVLLFVSFCVAGIWFFRSSGKDRKPADGGAAEASSSKTTTTTTASTTAK